MNNNNNNIFNVFEFELIGFLKSKSNWIIIGIATLLTCIAMYLPTLLNMDLGIFSVFNSDSDVTIGIVNNNPYIDTTTLDNSIYTIFDSQEQCEQAYIEETIKEYYVIDDTINYYSSNSMYSNYYDLLDYFYNLSTYNLLIENGVSPEQIQEIDTFFTSVETHDIKLEDNKIIENNDSDNHIINSVIGMVLIFTQYMILILIISFISLNVVTEKSNRTMESLLSITSSHSLIFGKVIGISVGLLIQLSIMVGLILINFNIATTFANNNIVDKEMLNTLSNFTIPVDLLIVFVIFTMLGFLLYAFFVAGLASTVDKIEDTNTANGIAIILIVIALFICINTQTDPNSTFATVTSYIPFFTPMVMLLRYATGSVGLNDIYISIAIMIVSIYIMSLISAKIYKAGSLLYGNKKGFFSIIKLVFFNK